VLLHVNVQNQKNDNKLEVDCLFVARKQTKVEAYVGMLQVEGRRCYGNLVMVKCESQEVNDDNNMIEREGGQKKGRVEVGGG
jgi:hypothetical protein